MENIEVHYSVEDAARLLGGLSKGTLYNWAYQGKLQRVKVGGRLVISESEVRRLLSEGAGPKAIAKISKLSQADEPAAVA